MLKYKELSKTNFYTKVIKSDKEQFWLYYKEVSLPRSSLYTIKKSER